MKVKDVPSSSSSYNTFSKSKALAECCQEVLLRIIQSASTNDQESWVVESNESCTDDIDITSEYEQFLSPQSNPRDDTQKRGYCSFVLQDNSNYAVSMFARQHVPKLKLKQHGYQSNQNQSLSLPLSLPILFSNAEEE